MPGIRQKAPGSGRPLGSHSANSVFAQFDRKMRHTAEHYRMH